uniref:ABC transmembrane type-1 domain-containing protein n=1 Tax=Timema poppense TaxID=170557 RepID=A0A7R9CWK4_TIMPO|nr:unnamed protein product [Timema poppensis]
MSLKLSNSPMAIISHLKVFKSLPGNNVLETIQQPHGDHFPSEDLDGDRIFVPKQLDASSHMGKRLVGEGRMVVPDVSVYTIPIFKKGYKGDLEESDLLGPSVVGDTIEATWFAELELSRQRNRKPNLLKVVFRAFYWDFLILGAFQMVCDMVLRMSQPLILGHLLSYFKPGSGVTKQEAYISSAVLALIVGLTAIVYNHTVLRSFNLGMRVRVALSSLIYRKGLILELDRYRLAIRSSSDYGTVSASDGRRLTPGRRGGFSGSWIETTYATLRKVEQCKDGVDYSDEEDKQLARKVDEEKGRGLVEPQEGRGRNVQDNLQKDLVLSLESPATTLNWPQTPPPRPLFGPRWRTPNHPPPAAPGLDLACDASPSGGATGIDPWYLELGASCAEHPPSTDGVAAGSGNDGLDRPP